MLQTAFILLLTFAGNGFIDFEELRTVLKSCMDESALQLSDSNIDQLTRALFEDADVDKSGTITFEELQAELDKHPGVIENLTIRYAKRGLYTQQRVYSLKGLQKYH